MQTCVPVIIAAEKFMNYLSFRAEPINNQAWEFGQSVLAAFSAVHNRATVYLLSVHEPHYIIFAVIHVARVHTCRDQSDCIRLKKPSTLLHALGIVIDSMKTSLFTISINSPKDLACLAQHSDVRLTVIFKHASVVENYRLLTIITFH
jgi:hypothetical protein